MKHDDDDDSHPNPEEALCLAEAYEEKAVFRPALIIYKSLLKTAQLSLRAKVNIGNVQFKLKNYPLAIKYYKKALDQVGQNDTRIYANIMQNIGLALVQQELYSEAFYVFAYIVKQCPDLKSYIHLVLCAYACGSASKIRQNFPGMFTLSAIGDIHQIEKTVSLIAPMMEDTEEDGFNWCVDIIRTTRHAWIADNLEVTRIVNLMRGGRIKEGLKHLGKFEMNASNLTEKSKVNLSFVYLSLAQFSKVEELLKDCTSARAYNNFGAMKMIQADYVAAKQAFEMALNAEVKFYEASYNLALVEKKLGNLARAQRMLNELREKFPFPCNSMTTYQTIQMGRGKASVYNNLQSNLELFGVSLVSDPNTLKEIGNLYKLLSNQKMSSWYMEEARSVNPLT